MGDVLLAYDGRLHRHVAIKRLHSDALVTPQARERLRREAAAAATLNHSAIVQIYDILTEASGEAIVMEYVEGRTLRRDAREWPAAGETGDHDRASDRRRPRRSSRQGLDPPGPQDPERHRHSRGPGQDPRFRPRQAPRKLDSRGRAHSRGRAARNAEGDVARAGSRAVARPALRSLFAGRAAATRSARDARPSRETAPSRRCSE